MTTAQRSPGLAAAFLAALREDRVTLRTTMPARVISFDASTQTVSVQPAFKRFHATLGELDYPVLPGVRVALPRGGGFGLSLPLAVAAGNTGTLTFCERTLDRWNVAGGEVDPEDDELHGLNGAIFRPDIHPDDDVPGNIHATDLVLSNDAASFGIWVSNSDVRIGDSSASDFAALASLVETELAAIKSAIAGAAVVPSDGGAAFKTNILAALVGFPASVAATKVKVK